MGSVAVRGVEPRSAEKNNTGKRMYIETYGCSANQAESEIMAGLLSEAGFEPVNAMGDCDFIIINTCFVKTPTEQKIMERIRYVVKRFPGKKLVICGCMPEVAEVRKKINGMAPNASMVSTHNITGIVDVLGGIGNKNERALLIGKSSEKKLCNPKVRKNELVGITEISHGCNGNCSYCCVRIAKGALNCYSSDEIIEDVKNALRAGCGEVWLTSQDNASYMFNGMDVSGLLEKICGLEGDFRVRVGMMNPDNAIKILDGLIHSYKDEKVYKFLHVPVQSGSDRVLKLMKRRYGVSDFLKIVSEFRKEIPSITISTDIIAGFPTETENDFRKTMELLKRTKPDVVNVSKFGKRPGTEAGKMKQLDSKVIKERSAKLSDIARKIALEKNRKWIGWEGDILVTERGKGKNQFLGRNSSYKPVIVKSSKSLMGKTLNVKIQKAGIAHLMGTGNSFTRRSG